MDISSKFQFVTIVMTVQIQCQDQTYEKLAVVVCIHCKISSNIIHDYDECWCLDGALQLGPDDEDGTVVKVC